MIYLDNNATTPIDPEVFAAMEPYLKEEYGNPSSKFYTLADRANQAVEEAREKVASLINAEPREIIFTSSATESNNFIIKGVADYMKHYQDKGNHIVTSKVEHPSVIWANNETGNVNDIDKIGKILKERDVLFHIDATQAVGRLYVDVRILGLDFMSFSAHKLYGPKGIGAAFLKAGKYTMPDLTSLIHGGDNQEAGYRAGTLCVHNIVGFGKAAEIAKREMDQYRKQLLRLEVEFKKIIKEKYDDLIFLTDEDNHVPGVVSFLIPDLNNMIHIRKLAKKVALSSGSACSITGESPVLNAMGRGEDKTNFFRVSFNKYNTMEEVEVLKDLI